MADTVAELIAYLQTVPQDAIVVLSSDPGNRFQAFGGRSEGLYEVNEWQGEYIGYSNLEEEPEEYDTKEEMLERGFVPCVVLWP